MATKVTNEDILRINELYYKHKVYAEVARQTGFSASTVKKYVVANWKPATLENVKRFDITMLPENDFSIFTNIENYGELCVLSDLELQEMKELWKELTL